MFNIIKGYQILSINGSYVVLIKKYSSRKLFLMNLISFLLMNNCLLGKPFSIFYLYQRLVFINIIQFLKNTSLS